MRTTNPTNKPHIYRVQAPSGAWLWGMCGGGWGMFRETWEELYSAARRRYAGGY